MLLFQVAFGKSLVAGDPTAGACKTSPDSPVCFILETVFL